MVARRIQYQVALKAAPKKNMVYTIGEFFTWHQQGNCHLRRSLVGVQKGIGSPDGMEPNADQLPTGTAGSDFFFFFISVRRKTGFLIECRQLPG